MRDLTHGYRALAIKTGGKVALRSRNNKDFSRRYASIATALVSLPDETVVDGEIVANESGRPCFNLLQNHGTAGVPILYYAFDLLVIGGRDITAEPLSVRRDLLQTHVLPLLSEPIRQCPELNASLHDLIDAVRAQGLEGLLAKRLDSSYEAGQRSGSWRKMRVNRGREFVIGGYTPSARNFDALIIGYYQDDQLTYVARTRNGFTPASRDQLYKRLRSLEISACPFVNLREARSGRWGEGLTAEKMRECHWVKPVLVGEFGFVEWTPDNHLRHPHFVALREDQDASAVRREG